MNTVAAISTALFGAALATAAFTLSSDEMQSTARNLFGGVTVPHACADITPRILNRVLENAPLAKLVGLKVLEVTGTHDTGSTKSGLKCAVDVLASAGQDMTLHASTRTVNGNVYILVSLF